MQLTPLSCLLLLLVQVSPDTPCPSVQPCVKETVKLNNRIVFSLFKIFQIILTKIFRLDGFSQKEFCPEVLDLYSKLDSESDSLKRQSIIADLKSKVRLGVSFRWFNDNFTNKIILLVD